MVLRIFLRVIAQSLQGGSFLIDGCSIAVPQFLND
jgi:hypothetical protein